MSILTARSGLFGKRARLALAVPLLGAALATTAVTVGIDGAVARADVATPAISVPPAGSHGFPFLAEAENLGAQGYSESEYFISGTATSYAKQGTWRSDGLWTARPNGTAAYKTRMLVRRPTDPAKFNGTVVVEWLNVSGQVDISPDYWFEHDELLRSGYAWVGVSAQSVGVNGGVGNLPGLKEWDPQRYGTLVQPGDKYAYDIFSQAGQALRRPNGPNPLAGLTIKTMLADGESQSAGFMTTYANAVQPLAKVYDGIMIHSNSAIAAPVSGNILDILSMPNPTKIRTDLSVPTFVVLTETDVPGHATARQPNTSKLVTWELAGTSHGDEWAHHLGDPTIDKSLGDGKLDPGCAAGSAPLNDGPGHYSMNAALAHLNRWAQGGTPPPAGPNVTTGGNGNAVQRDAATGLATGGIRLPDVAVPTRTLSGQRQSSLNAPFCGLYGSSDPWNADADPWDKHNAGDPSDPATPRNDEPNLKTLYPTHDGYVAKVQAAAASSVASGYLLPADADIIVAAAQASSIGS